MALPVVDSDLAKSWQTVLAPHSLGYRIKLLSQLLGRQFQERLEPHGLTPFHWIVLCCLWEQDGLATSDIGERLSQVGATLTGVIDRMEERGVLYRQRDRQDRRIWRIWLTEEGKKLQAVLTPLAQEVCSRTFLGIAEPELRQFSNLVDTAIANLSSPAHCNHAKAFQPTKLGSPEG